MTIDTIRSLLGSDVDAADACIHAGLASDVQLIPLIAHHLLDSGGKRLRLLLVLLAARSVQQQSLVPAVSRLAAIIEFIHSATLLHDDVVDASTLRRGQETANAIWGNTASVLVGDFLLSRAFEQLVEIGHLPLMRDLAKATNTIASGEVLQLQYRHVATTTEADYLKMIEAKTAVLFAVAARGGAQLAGGNHTIQEALAAYGLHLGIAFQLVDDALDYCSKSEELGKNIGDDFLEGKPTLPFIRALTVSVASQAKMLTEALAKPDQKNWAEVLEVIESTDAIAYTYALADAQVLSARRALDHLPESPYRTALLSLADFAVQRRY